MNIPAFQTAARLAGGATNPNPQAAQQRPPAPVPQPAQNLPREAAERAPDARPVLDLSDTALTRRDIPRGSFIDIVA